MKHNEVKAYFKKKLVEALPNYDILSIDETMSSRNIYIVDKQTMDAKIYVDSWFATNDFHIKAFVIEYAHIGGRKINKYEDYFCEVKGNYNQILFLGKVIKEITEKLDSIGSKV